LSYVPDDVIEVNQKSPFKDLPLVVPANEKDVMKAYETHLPKLYKLDQSYTRLARAIRDSETEVEPKQKELEKTIRTNQRDERDMLEDSLSKNGEKLRPTRFGKVIKSILKDDMFDEHNEEDIELANFLDFEIPPTPKTGKRSLTVDFVNEDRVRNKDQPLVRFPTRLGENEDTAYGMGRRKSANAKVWITKGKGNILVNSRPFLNYFPRMTARHHITEPLFFTETEGKFDVIAEIRGGGVSGQAGAMRLGIARALQNFDPDFREVLKSSGTLTRDPRRVERKKPGREKARKKYQWVKR